MKGDILRPLDCIVLPLLASHIILLFIALVTFVAVCREAVSSRRPRSFFVTLEPRGTRPMANAMDTARTRCPERAARR